MQQLEGSAVIMGVSVDLRVSWILWTSFDGAIRPEEGQRARMCWRRAQRRGSDRIGNSIRHVETDFDARRAEWGKSHFMEPLEVQDSVRLDEESGSGSGSGSCESGF